MVPILSISRLPLCVCLTFVSWTRAEVFTAISDVAPLLDTQKRIIYDLESYIVKEEQSLLTLKKHLYKYKKEHDKAMENTPNYLGNPIYYFKLIKRLTTDIEVIEKSIDKGSAFNMKIKINYEEMKYPTMEDLTGAVQALTRLQQTYKLKVEELAAGVLDGVVYSAPMTTNDCYEVGQALYDEKDYNNAIAWMKEAYKKYEADEHKDALLFNNTDIMEYIGHSYYFLGDTKSGLQWTYKVLEIDPGHPRALNNIPKFKNSTAIDELQMKKPNRRNSFERDRKNYEALCRGEMDIGADISKRLKCWYASDKHPFSKYAPFKVEQLYITPNIYIFHEVLFDNEIEVIKSVAKSRRVTVHKSRTGEVFLAPTYRISTSSWLKDEVHEIVARVSRRVQQMTGLDLDTAEDLQVVKYGIGGHYDSHYDFTMKNEKNYPDSMGNRLATVLFYMSEVAKGGATVFTELGLSVFPEKGAAAFWMNLHPSGEGDMATKHAACPVLDGSKWVCTKWIHQCGQELIKPCTLEYQKEGFLRKLPRPVKKSYR